MITTKTHGVLDYIVGAALIAAPWLFGFPDGGAEMWVPVALGAGSLVYSLITDYELGIAHLLPMRGHLLVDFLAGLFLAASPWLFGFADKVWLPHVVVGLFMLASSLTTSHVPSGSARRSRHSVPHAKAGIPR